MIKNSFRIFQEIMNATNLFEPIISVKNSYLEVELIQNCHPYDFSIFLEIYSMNCILHRVMYLRTENTQSFEYKIN